MVHSVERDCQAVPLGSFKLTPSKELRYNEQFRGLTIKDAFDLNSYLHFRSPDSEEKQA